MHRLPAGIYSPSRIIGSIPLHWICAPVQPCISPARTSHPPTTSSPCDHNGAHSTPINPVHPVTGSDSITFTFTCWIEKAGRVSLPAECCICHASSKNSKVPAEIGTAVYRTAPSSEFARESDGNQDFSPRVSALNKPLGGISGALKGMASQSVARLDCEWRGNGGECEKMIGRV